MGVRDTAMRTQPIGRLDVTSQSFASTLSLPPAQLAYAFQSLGDEPMMVQNLELAGKLAPNPAIAAILAQLRLRPLLPAADSP